MITKCSAKAGTRQSNRSRSTCNPQRANSRVVISCPVLLQHSTRVPMLPSHPLKVHPRHNKLDALPFILKQLHASALSQPASEIILCDWRDGTKSSTGHTFPSGKITATRYIHIGMSPVSANSSSRDELSSRINQVRHWL